MLNYIFSYPSISLFKKEYYFQEINDYRYRYGERPLDPDDLDNDNEADFLTATKHKIDNYLAKQVQ